jgi:hypothetical protein
MKTRARPHVDAVIAALSSLGFVPDGATREEVVRVGTIDSPIYGGTGGELRAFGGRARFWIPDTDVRATVGDRTTFLYRRTGSVDLPTETIAHLKTREVTLDGLRVALASASPRPSTPDEVDAESAARAWDGLSASMRVTLLNEAGVSLGSSEERQIAAGIREPGWLRCEDPSGAALHALGRRGLLVVGKTVLAPGSGPGWHTPRTVTDLGRRVAAHGGALLAEDAEIGG